MPVYNVCLFSGLWLKELCFHVTGDVEHNSLDSTVQQR
jgi:hypothetical protein